VSEQPRDWDKELADIDRAMARLPQPSGPPAAAGPAAGPAAGAAARTPGAPPGHAATTTAWLRVVLVLLLAGAMPFWPYGRDCGFGLFAYMAAGGVVVLGGVWAAVSTWHRRRPVAHILALLVTVWGLALLAAQVLPRVGYAKQAVRWTCG
jgi:hypothetical protein